MPCFIPPQQLGPNLWLLGEHHLCLYLIRDRDQAAIYEVGMSGTTPLVLAQLDHLGLAPEDVSWVILSHAHSDHSAGARGLLEGLPQARLVLTAKSWELLGRASTLGRFSADDDFSSAEVIRRSGLDGPQAWPPLEPLPGDRLLLMEAGESLMVGGQRVELLPGAGHAPGGLLAWLPGQGAFFASDSAGFRHPDRPGFPLYFVSYPDYMEVLEGIAARHPSVLGLGHQEALAGEQAARYLEDTVAHLRAWHQKIAQRFKQSGDQKEVSAWLFEAFYRDELTIYSPANIAYCCGLLVQRSLQAEGLSPDVS
ncbi:MAG: MBL fold metallo-hydrolase [Proteobacteria bacterium]|nr:MBL fold metallo-hydrolase [Pseudomonadota bacterium]MBU4277719.1 MBL fold metallo-hydrolase [Pseudomonadota bacterium]MBU4385125.1 MBL fold metallo-hydrolase [Pseudomonadota bacterium]MBU4604183.1 MBL fold metallo-hydrolase [Pseudomonadota bacterium]MCG2764732.1 MBL fold metallo-hydrolase [Desulfarculaceae bacterium]